MAITDTLAEQVTYNGDAGAIIGATSSDKIGFYGKVPVIQRAYSSAVHATSGFASSADFGATQLAIVVEIANTLVGLGIWATA